jgi:hypothetical protein
MALIGDQRERDTAETALSDTVVQGMSDVGKSVSADLEQSAEALAILGRTRALRPDVLNSITAGIASDPAAITTDVPALRLVKGLSRSQHLPDPSKAWLFERLNYASKDDELAAMVAFEILARMQITCYLRSNQG